MTGGRLVVAPFVEGLATRPAGAHTTAMQRALFTSMFVVFAAAVDGGCVVARSTFVPLEHLQGSTWHGYAQAEYTVALDNGAAVVKLWSPGAVRTANETRVIVGFQVANSGDSAITLDPGALRLDAIVGDDEVSDLSSADVQGTLTIAPHALCEARATFALGEVAPSDLDAYRVRWQLTTAKQSYLHATAFARAYPSGYGAGPYPYGGYPYGYDPFWRPLPGGFFGPYPGGYFGVGLGVDVYVSPRYGHGRPHRGYRR